MIEKWKILESKEVFSSPFIKIKEEKLRRTDGKLVGPYYAMERDDVVIVVPVTRDGRIVLARQYKNGIADVILEVPAGFIERGEDPKKAAERELLEETGYRTTEFIRLGQFTPSAGMARNKIYIFLAKNVVKVADQNLDPFEEIETEEVSYKEVLEEIKNIQSRIAETNIQLAVLLAEGYL